MRNNTSYNASVILYTFIKDQQPTFGLNKAIKKMRMKAARSIAQFVNLYYHKIYHRFMKELSWYAMLDLQILQECNKGSKNFQKSHTKTGIHCNLLYCWAHSQDGRP
ncbi:uncharacterized protein TRIADDRAFT_58792 [Trichoplax adhaerens]|uniref:Uncharacterized protein n=1 Tax=Trichoplax adhaerens TaxID=10228 RepID=B3S3P0_TRIAD|nr:predicted protein [Trichoplax adhaerens]EDV22505.1 predicted protein [Trichoplax adhaerens]|eukprot:XP_002115049.1 predicted protein [Trichoplax adhaerens]